VEDSVDNKKVVDKNDQDEAWENRCQRAKARGMPQNRPPPPAREMTGKLLAFNKFGGGGLSLTNLEKRAAQCVWVRRGHTTKTAIIKEEGRAGGE